MLVIAYHYIRGSNHCINIDCSTRTILDSDAHPLPFMFATFEDFVEILKDHWLKITLYSLCMNSNLIPKRIESNCWKCMLFLCYDKYVVEFFVAVKGVSVPFTIASILLCYRECFLTSPCYITSVARCKVTKTRTSHIHVWFPMMSLRAQPRSPLKSRPI